MKSTHSLTIRETAVALGLRCHSVYALLRDSLLDGLKLQSGEWRVNPESLARYKIRQALRRRAERSALHDRAIDVTETSGVHTEG